MTIHTKLCDLQETFDKDGHCSTDFSMRVPSSGLFCSSSWLLEDLYIEHSWRQKKDRLAVRTSVTLYRWLYVQIISALLILFLISQNH